jgi:GNAT superfamily N-acetyltransferase
MADGELEAAAAQAWAGALGCGAQLPAEPGAHLIPGGPGLRGLRGIYMASVGPAVFVYCHDQLQSRAAAVMAAVPAGELFTARTCATITGLTERDIHGPSWHGFIDAAHFTPAVPPRGNRLDRADPLLAGLRISCGEEEWAEGGFADPDAIAYGIEEHGRLVAAGNLTPFRGHPADVGLLTRPSARGRGLARQVAVRMINDALPAAGIVRYRALASNAPSLAIARSLGFADYGQNLIGRLPS